VVDAVAEAVEEATDGASEEMVSVEETKEEEAKA
jgi:hypothetical protein